MILLIVHFDEPHRARYHSPSTGVYGLLTEDVSVLALQGLNGRSMYHPVLYSFCFSEYNEQNGMD